MSPLPTLEQYLARRLRDYRRDLLRRRIYFSQAPGDASVRLDRCRHAVTPERQCDGPQEVRRGEFWVCRTHEHAWEVER